MNLKISFTQIPNFRYMEKSENVKKIQEILNELGYDLGNGGIDSIYGKDTKRAIDEFVKIGKIKNGGTIGVTTKEALTETSINLGNYVSLSCKGKKQILGEQNGRNLFLKLLKDFLILHLFIVLI